MKKQIILSLLAFFCVEQLVHGFVGYGRGYRRDYYDGRYDDDDRDAAVAVGAAALGAAAITGAAIAASDRRDDRRHDGKYRNGKGRSSKKNKRRNRGNVL